MKKKLFFSGILSILLIFGFFAGCDNGTTTTEHIPGPTINLPGATETQPGPTIEVPLPGENYNALVKALLDAGDAYIKDTDVPKNTQRVTITGHIVVQGNNDIKVPEGVVLEIAKGGRLIIEANAMLYVRDTGKVIVKGDLYFEKYANWDDVRQAKIVGDIEVDGGTVYDKTDEAWMLQHISKIFRGGKLVYSGGTGISQTHEKFVLGYPTFTGDGYIKPVFSEGWSKFNLVRPTSPAVAGDTLLSHAANGVDDPALLGFELYGAIELTGGQLALPNSDNSTPKILTFTVKNGATLTIGKDASLATQTYNVDDACQLVVEEKGSVAVDGTLHVANMSSSGAQPLNYGTITVKEGGSLYMDDTAFGTTVWTAFNLGQVNFLPGSSLLYDRAVLPLNKSWIGPGSSAVEIQTASKTTISFTPVLMTISGDKATFKAAGTWNTLPLSLAVTGKGTDVTFKGAVQGAATGQNITVNGGTLTLEVSPGGTNALAGITVTGSDAGIIAEAGVAFANAALVLDNGAKGTFKQNAAVTFAAGTLLPATVTARNGATVEYAGAPSYTYANPVAYSGYKVVLDKAPLSFTTITLTNAELTAPSFTLAGAVSLTNSKITFPSGTVAGVGYAWTLVGSTVDFSSMTSSGTGSTPVIGLSVGSTINVKGTLDFSGAAPVITLFDAASKITGASKAKISSDSGATTGLTINAPGGSDSVKGLTFTGAAPALSVLIGPGKTAESNGTEWAILP